MLIIKSHAGVLEQLTRTVQRMHPYDEPEVRIAEQAPPVLSAMLHPPPLHRLLDPLELVTLFASSTALLSVG